MSPSLWWVHCSLMTIKCINSDCVIKLDIISTIKCVFTITMHYGKYDDCPFSPMICLKMQGHFQNVVFNIIYVFFCLFNRDLWNLCVFVEWMLYAWPQCSPTRVLWILTLNRILVNYKLHDFNMYINCFGEIFMHKKKMFAWTKL